MLSLAYRARRTLRRERALVRVWRFRRDAPINLCRHSRAGAAGRRRSPRASITASYALADHSRPRGLRISAARPTHNQRHIVRRAADVRRALLTCRWWSSTSGRATGQ